MTIATAFSQQLRITGKIVDEKGKPVSFVSVHFENVERINLTDKDGFFFAILDKNDSLYFTHVGYSGYKYKVRSSGYLEVQLKEIPCLATRVSSSQIFFFTPSAIDGKLIKEELTNEIIPKKEIAVDSPTLEASDYIYPDEIDPSLGGMINNFLKGINVKELRHKGEIKLQFLITKAGKIEQTSVLKSYAKDVDQLIIQNLMTNFKTVPAEQNGVRVNTLCELELKLEKNNDNVFVIVH